MLAMPFCCRILAGTCPVSVQLFVAHVPAALKKGMQCCECSTMTAAPQHYIAASLAASALAHCPCVTR